MLKDRYSIGEAVNALQTSRSTLYTWLKKAGLVEQVRQFQRMPDDMREHWLSRAQLEQLAAAHRRTLTGASPDAEAIDSALSERVEDVEARLKRLEDRVDTLASRLPAEDGLPF